MKNRLYVLGALLVMMVGFQNCGNAGFSEGEIASVSESSLRSLDLQGNDQIQVKEDSSMSPSPNRYVSLRSIQFSRGYVIGVYESAMTNDQTPIAYNPESQFQYRLEMQTGKILLVEANQVLTSLTNSERSELNSILNSSMVATLLDFPLPPNAANYYCPQEYPESYATLRTTSEVFELGNGKSLCHAKDLFKVGQGGLRSGLREFLQKVEARIQAM